MSKEIFPESLASVIDSIWGSGAFWGLGAFLVFTICLKMALNASMKINHRNVKYGFGFSFAYIYFLSRSGIW